MTVLAYLFIGGFMQFLLDYDPKAWAKLAKEAGMKYMFLTAKHHNSFCLFDSPYTDYKSSRQYSMLLVTGFVTTTKILSLYLLEVILLCLRKLIQLLK